MNTYRNYGGDSGIKSYEINANSIRIMFSDLSIYEYTLSSVGVNNLSKMKLLASQGTGLNSFINRIDKYKYFRRVR